MEGAITQKITILKGATGNTEWWTEEDWERHRQYVLDLKSRGEYLKPETIEVTYVPSPLFNEYPGPKPLDSYRFVILDLNNPESDNSGRH